MRRSAAFLAAVALTACSEYDVVDDFPPTGDPNPPGVEQDMQTDRVVQSTVASVDVLWVVDNSGSMSDEQTRLAENFAAFMGWFLGSDLDYHIGVVSTDMTNQAEGGRLQAGGMGGEYLYIDPLTPEPVTVFQPMALLGIGGDSTERGRDAVFGALDDVSGHRNDTNAGFYREEASLAVIVISDEDDYSTIGLPEFTDWFAGLKPDRDMLSFSSIVGTEETTGGTCVGATEPGRDYLEITRAIGGVEWSICDEDWAPALEQLGMQAAGLRREFFLTELPVVESLHVWVELDGAVVADLVRGEDYEYSAQRNSVRLLEITPEPLAEIFVEYEVRSTAWPEE